MDTAEVVTVPAVATILIRVVTAVVEAAAEAADMVADFPVITRRRNKRLSLRLFCQYIIQSLQ